MRSPAVTISIVMDWGSFVRENFYTTKQRQNSDPHRVRTVEQPCGSSVWLIAHQFRRVWDLENIFLRNAVLRNITSPDR